MLQPEDGRAPGQEGRRTVVRRLRCLEGTRRVMHRVEPREDYRLPADVTVAGEVATLTMPSVTLGVWSSHPMRAVSDGQAAHAAVTLRAGETPWAVLDDTAHVGRF